MLCRGGAVSPLVAACSAAAAARAASAVAAAAAGGSCIQIVPVVVLVLVLVLVSCSAWHTAAHVEQQRCPCSPAPQLRPHGVMFSTSWHIGHKHAR